MLSFGWVDSRALARAGSRANSMLGESRRILGSLLGLRPQLGEKTALGQRGRETGRRWYHRRSGRQVGYEVKPTPELDCASEACESVIGSTGSL